MSVNESESGAVVSATYYFAGPNGERLSETIGFPARQSVIEALLEKAGVGAKEPWRVLYSSDYQSGINGLARELYAAGDFANPNKLNALAARIQNLDKRVLEDFSQILGNVTYRVGMNALIDLVEQWGDAEGMRILYKNPDRLDIPGVTLSLPATDEQIDAAFVSVEAYDVDCLDVIGVSSRVPFLAEAVLNLGEGGFFEEMNDLAAKVQALDDAGREALEAVFKMERMFGSAAEIIDIVENVDVLRRQPGISAWSYGKQEGDGDLYVI